MDNRELVRVACPIVEGNEQGFYLTYADEVPEGAKLFDETKKPQKKSAKSDSEESLT